MACSSACRAPGTHATYGECMRAKNVKTEKLDRTQQKKADKTLDNYAEARRYGVQPASTRAKDVELAVRASEKTGVAYQAT